MKRGHNVNEGEKPQDPSAVAPESPEDPAAPQPDDVPGWDPTYDQPAVVGLDRVLGPAEPDDDDTDYRGNGNGHDTEDHGSDQGSNVLTLPKRRSIFAKPESIFPPFPQRAWTGLFQQYADMVYATTEASEAAIWAAHAAGLSLILGRSCGLEWFSGMMYPTIHVAILGPTGAGRKTASIDDAVKLLVNRFKPLPQLPGEPDPCVVLNGMGSGEGFMEAIRDLHWRDPGAKKNTPPHVQQGRSALFVIPELGGLMEKAAAGAAGSMLDFIINAWDCKEEWTHQTRTTKETAPFKATNATAVILAASTIEWLGDTLQTTHVKNGLVNRFIWMAGNPRSPIAFRPPIDKGKLQAYEQQVGWCLAAIKGQRFTFDAAAYAYHQSRYDTLYHLRNDRSADATNSLSIAATGRTDITALRVAMLIAASHGSLTIDSNMIETGWEVVDYSNKIVDHLLASIPPKTMNEMTLLVMRRTKTAAEKSRNGSFTRRDVWRNVSGSGSKIPQTEFGKIFDAMIREGDVVRVPPGQGKGERYFLGEGAFEILDPH
jgi:hypothetical protein